MHGVREELLDQQADSIGIPLLKVAVSEGTNAEYERQMEALLLKAKGEGITLVVFGDIFLEDLRVYRENNLAKVGMKAVFPLWKMDTKWLIEDFIKSGFRTVTCCVNDGYLTEDWVGKEIDAAFVKDLAKNVDPCGENGEFHTFVFDGPIFKKPIAFIKGEIVYRKYTSPNKNENDVCKTDDPFDIGFWYCDLLLHE